MNGVDPAALTPDGRLEEVADVLARGVQRYLAAECKAQQQRENSQIRLAACADAEAPCGSHALNPKSTDPAA